MELKFNIFGSHDSTDVDAVVLMDDMPSHVEDRKRLASKIGAEFGDGWNVILARVDDGVIVDCTYPKASPDSLNNALLHTYRLHEQEHPLFVSRKLKRNRILAIYKTVRIISTYLTRTDYRTHIRPTMNWRNDFKLKLTKLQSVNFNQISSFNQANMTDLDIWKTYAFYLWQNIALVRDDIELYTKADVLDFAGPVFEPYLYRSPMLKNRSHFDSSLHWWIGKLLDMPIETEGSIIRLGDESANMELELPI